MRGLIQAAFDAVEETTNLVHRTHDGVVDRVLRRVAFVEPVRTPVRAVAAIERSIGNRVFQTIRAVNGATRLAVEAAADLAEHQIAASAAPERWMPATPLQSTAAGGASWLLDHAQAMANGLFGDALIRKQSRFALELGVRHHGRPLPLTRTELARAYPEASSRVCVFLHGLSLTEWFWCHSSEAHYGESGVTFGTRLAGDHGYSAVYVRYNSGRRVAENGRQLSTLLTELLDVYPVPIEELRLVGYSMGGLVARSAAHYGTLHGAPWLARLRQVICIGSPHHGSPHARAAHVLHGILRRVDAAAPQVIAEILNARSEGIRDLEYGRIVDDDHTAMDAALLARGGRVCLPPLVDGVGYAYIASTVTRDPTHIISRMLGDLFVTLASASGDAREPGRRIAFHSGKIFHGLHHFDLSSHPDVYQALRDLIAVSPTTT